MQTVECANPKLSPNKPGDLQFELTTHAEVRCQQRGVKREALDTILCFGRRKRRGGADVYYMDKIARDRVRQELGSQHYRHLSDKLDIYAVVSDDLQVITVAPRVKRMKF